MATALTQTTLSAAITAGQTSFAVASATGISSPTNNQVQKIYVIDPDQTKGELMSVLAVNGTTITVSRLDQFKSAHASGSIVLVAPIDPTLGGFYEFDPSGSPTTNPANYTPWVNVTNGNQWLYSSVTSRWVPGWNNPSSIKGVTALVASAAGAIVPSGPLFHVDGTAAVTGFTIPVGFSGGSFSVVPDANFTWTTAGNIGLAGTAVTGRVLTFTWDSNSGKFYPSYV